MIKIFVLLAHVVFANGDMDDLTRGVTFPTEEACVTFMKNDANEEVHMFYTDIKEVTFACKAVMVKDNSI